MIEPDKESIEQALTELLRNYEGFPFDRELKEKLQSAVIGIATVASQSTVQVLHSPLEGNPNRIEITIGLGMEYLQYMLDP